MKVLVTPGLDLDRDQVAAGVARSLAGSEGTLVSLAEVGVKNLSRPITRAEVARLRQALRSVSEAGSECGRGAGVVGCICPGVSLSDESPSDVRMVVAVTDHANLTWRSPLAGRGGDEVGPRFPAMTGIYAPEPVLQRLGAEGGIIVASGVVAGVEDHEHLSAYESETVQVNHHVAACSELVPVAIVAAQMGLRIAAAIATWVH